MNVAPLLLELYGRIPPLVARSLDGIDGGRLLDAPPPATNSIGWLIWHLTRVQDHHLGEILGVDQVWEGDDWAARFGLEPESQNIGYGHGAADIAAVQPDSVGVLLDYHDAVDARTREYLATLTAADLDRIVDRRWDPHVSLGVRLVSIADDSLQHVGQALYLRGWLG
ncbi:MAG: DUF664 domain-containing protein [Actinomycetia bacterium]|nr:DUF664 domain-containing protein [Actinomycetes bacterium]